MKSIVKNVHELDGKVFRGADAVNHEGSKAWSMSDKEMLKQYAYTGVLGNTFYATQKDIIDEAIDLIKRSDAKDLAESIVIGRNEGYIRSFSILGLVYLSMKDIDLFKKVFDKIILTGNDMEDFINICHTVRGFGRGIKTAINNWLMNHVNPYYALKYKKQIADAVRIARPKVNDVIYAFILNNYAEVDKEKVNIAFEEYQELNAFNEIPNLLENKDFDKVAEYINKYRLDVDSLTAYYSQFNNTIWNAIANQTPVMRFLKYLNKFEKVGIDVSEIAERKITVENLKKAKVFPFRLFMAYMAINNQNITNILANVLNDYIVSTNWENFANKSFAICPDVSGSMTGLINNGNLRYIDIAAMFTGFLVKGCKNVTVIPWAGQVKEYKVPFADSVISHMKYISSIGGGGTAMGCSVRYLLKNNIKKDVCIFITDTEDYSRKSVWDRSNTGSWIEAWIDYKKIYPNSKAIIIRGDAYHTNPMSEEQCKKYNIYQIFGWNDKVVDYIQRIV